jgi:DNA-binding MarR family transcriptional regulator
MSMSELASYTGTSLSRLSHAVTSLEKRDWVRRSASTEDARVQVATLTDEGQRLLELVAPAHVAEVRRRVFDRLTPEQVAALREC